MTLRNSHPALLKKKLKPYRLVDQKHSNVFFSNSGKSSDTAHRKAVRSLIVAERVHGRSVEGHGPSVRMPSRVRRTTPTVAGQTDIRHGTIRAIAIAGSGGKYETLDL